MYHMKQSRETTLRMPINSRKWQIYRFVEQKEKENEAMENARRAAQRKGKK
jgi:hypothetical protein